MPIPVYLSRHGNLPSPYGAFITWAIGEKAVIHGHDSKDRVVTVRSTLKVHNSAPVIDSALGEGKYVYEVEFQGELIAISAERLSIPTK